MTTEIEYRIIAEFEPTSVEEIFGDCLKQKEEINNRLKARDVWAWCIVEVRASFEGFAASESVGCCSFENEEDFIENSGFYASMKIVAKERLVKTLEKAASAFAQMQSKGLV